MVFIEYNSLIIKGGKLYLLSNNGTKAGSQTRGQHVAREGVLYGPRCF